MSPIGQIENGGVISFKWIIPNFVSCCEKSIESMQSPVFAGSWSLTMYPTDVYICLCNERQIQVMASATLYMIDKNGDKMNKSVQIYKMLFKPGDSVRKYMGPQREILDLLDTDTTLVIRCEISYYDRSGIKNEINNAPEAVNSIINVKNKDVHQFEKLLESKKFSDVTFIVEDKTIHAHKGILAVSSMVLDAMFLASKEDAQCPNIVHIEEVEYAVFKELLRFIYSRKVNDIDKIAKELLLAANKYGVDELRDICIDALFNKLTAANAIEYLEFADKIGCTYFKSEVLRFIRSHAVDVLIDPKFELVAERNPVLLCEITRAVAKKPRLK